MPNTILHVPTTVAEMLPPKSDSLISEMTRLHRENWDVVHPIFQMVAGEIPSANGSPIADQFAGAFLIKEIAVAKNYTAIAALNAAQIRKLMRYAYKRNTGVAVRLLEAQRKNIIQQRAAE